MLKHKSSFGTQPIVLGTSEVLKNGIPTIFLHSKRFDEKLSGNVDGRTPAPPEMIEMYLSFTYQLVQDCFKSTVVSIPRSLT